MTFFEQRIAYGCIDRIHYIWFDSHDEPFGSERIAELFKALMVVAPYECCRRAYCLWLAFRSAEDARLWHLSRHRLRVFDDGLRALKEVANQLPEAARQ